MLCISAQMFDGQFDRCLRVSSDTGEINQPSPPSGDTLSPGSSGHSDRRVWKDDPGMPSAGSLSNSGPICPSGSTCPALLPLPGVGWPPRHLQASDSASDKSGGRGQRSALNQTLQAAQTQSKPPHSQLPAPCVSVLNHFQTQEKRRKRGAWWWAGQLKPRRLTIK